MKSKKWLCLLIAGAALLLCACGSAGSTSEADSVEPESAVASSSQEATAANSESAASAPKSTQNPNSDFRNACWGDSMETVKTSEDAEFVELEADGSKTTLAMEAKLSGYGAYAFYTFDNDKLCEGSYSFTDDFSNAAFYINGYEQIKELLTVKYGEPESDDIKKLEKDSLIEMAGDAKALEYGYVVYTTVWETDTTEITMAMLAQNFDISWVIRYSDINYTAEPNTSGL